MNSTEIQKMAQMEKEYWWHIGKRHLVETLVEHLFEEPKDLTILELGCGTGGVTEVLTKYGDVTGLDVSHAAVEYCKTRGLNNVFVEDITSMDIEKYRDKFDLVLALDVLEHIQDDVKVMSKVREMLKEDGLFFINVPAHKFLWSEHDEALEHKRRYHRVELTKKLKDTGYEIVHNSYFVFLISPLIILYRTWGNLFGKSAYPKTSYVMLPQWMNTLFVKMLALESKLIKSARLPFGVTLNVLGKKSEVYAQLSN